MRSEGTGSDQTVIAYSSPLFATTEMCPEKGIRTCSVLDTHEHFLLTIIFSAFRINLKLLTSFSLSQFFYSLRAQPSAIVLIFQVLIFSP